MRKNIFTIIILIVVLALLGYVVFGYYKTLTEEKKNPVVTMEIENYGTIEMELYPDMAPNTVKNFINLIQKGYYNGKVFSGLDSTCLYIGKTAEGEVENAKMSLVDDSIEAGSDSDKEYAIEGEFVANGYDDNVLKHEKGVVSMSRVDYTQFSSSLATESYNSANAQFCILLKDERALNGMYAAFGRVIKGMDVVEAISKLEAKVEDTTSSSEETSEEASEETKESSSEEDTTENENALKTFVNFPVIKNITVDTFGVDYGKPEVSEAFDYYNYMYQYYSNQYSN